MTRLTYPDDTAQEVTMSTNDQDAVERVQALCDEVESKGITSGWPFTVEAVRAAIAGNA